MNLSTTLPEKSAHHMNVSAFSGSDWWAHFLLPRQLFLRRIARWMAAHGRESFTLPDGGTHWVKDILGEKK